MPLPSRVLTSLGSLLLAHACYSAHEHSSLPNLNPPSNTLPTDLRSTSTLSSLPLDISLETLLSVLLICIGLVLGAEELRPISWRVWAGKVERGMGPKGQEGFRALEKGRRRGFLDIRTQRKEFADWVRGKGD